MKQIITIVFLAAFSILVSCKKESTSSTSISTTTLTATVTAGAWKVTSFAESGIDDTDSYSSYQFVFNSSGAVVASKTGSTATGTWQSLPDSGKTKLVINFTAFADFESISEDWVVLELSSVKIKLQHISGGGGGTDTLVFEKM